MVKVSPSDGLLAQCVSCPESIIDLVPSANEHIAWVDRVVAHLCTRDVHAAHLTIQ